MNLFKLWIFALCSINIIKSLNACSPIPNFNYATLEEQVKYASAVMVGKVDKILEGDGYNYAIVEFSVNKYLKGCGEASIIVTGFEGGSMCQNGVPEEGDELILYACKDDFPVETDSETHQKWKINTFSLFTGVTYLKYSSDYVQKVEALIDDVPQGFDDCSTLAVCGSRPDDFPTFTDEIIEPEEDDLEELDNY